MQYIAISRANRQWQTNRHALEKVSSPANTAVARVGDGTIGFSTACGTSMNW